MQNTGHSQYLVVPGPYAAIASNFLEPLSLSSFGTVSFLSLSERWLGIHIRLPAHESMWHICPQIGGAGRVGGVQGAGQFKCFVRRG